MAHEGKCDVDLSELVSVLRWSKKSVSRIFFGLLLLLLLLLPVSQAPPEGFEKDSVLEGPPSARIGGSFSWPVSSKASGWV